MEPIFAHIIVATLATAGLCGNAAVSAVQKSPAYEFAATLFTPETNAYWYGFDPGQCDVVIGRMPRESSGFEEPEPPAYDLWEGRFATVELPRRKAAKPLPGLQLPNTFNTAFTVFGGSVESGYITMPNVKMADEDEERSQAVQARLAAIDSYLQPLVNRSLLDYRPPPGRWGSRY